jgi:hypothetical protein
MKKSPIASRCSTCLGVRTRRSSAVAGFNRSNISIALRVCLPLKGISQAGQHPNPTELAVGMRAKQDYLLRVKLDRYPLAEVLDFCGRRFLEGM